jgi:hypothetical protein
LALEESRIRLARSATEQTIGYRPKFRHGRHHLDPAAGGKHRERSLSTADHGDSGAAGGEPDPSRWQCDPE